MVLSFWMPMVHFITRCAKGLIATPFTANTRSRGPTEITPTVDNNLITGKLVVGSWKKLLLNLIMLK